MSSRARLFPILLPLLCGYLFTACTPSPTSLESPRQEMTTTTPPAPATIEATDSETSPPTVPIPTVSPITTASPLATPTISEPPPPKLAHYQILATFDYADHLLSVSQTIRYPNNSSETLNDLILQVDALNYSDAFKLERLTWEDDTPIDLYGLGKGTLRIPLMAPLPPGDSLTILLAYQLNLPSLAPAHIDDIPGKPFGYSELQANFIDWYPYVPPYREGIGWLAHAPGPYGEHLAYEAADFDITLQLVEEIPDLVIAASAPAEITAQGYHYQHRNARNFMWSASHRYRSKSVQIGDTTVTSYYFPFHEAAGDQVLATTAEALALYERLFGPYQRPLISAVEADFSDGMEADGMYLLGGERYELFNRTPADFLVALAAHETAHAWWFGQVGNDQALDPWLDEALCTYSEYLFYEQLQPASFDWWWAYRLMFYQPRGKIDISIYDTQGLGYREYRDPVYLNGAVFLHELRVAMGEEVFFAFLKRYLETYQDRIATTEGFIQLAQESSPVDLSAIIARFFSN